MSEDDQKDEFIESLQKELDYSTDKNTQLTQALSSAGYGRDGNFLQYQLESIELLDKLENFYRGRYIGFDDDGNQVWKDPDDDESKTLNQHGVNLMMEVVTKYIDKNTVLSYYSEMRIYEIMADLGDELTLVLFCNYEEMGMNTYFKKTKFRMLIVTTLHMVESAYRRAISGRAMEEMNQSRIVTQSDHIGMGPIEQAKKKGRNIFNPLSWVN